MPNVGYETVHQSYRNSTAVEDHRNVSHRVTWNVKPTYPVLIGSSVKVFSTNPFALLPKRDKFLVKERTVGYARANCKLMLRSSATEAKQYNTRYQLIVI